MAGPTLSKFTVGTATYTIERYGSVTGSSKAPVIVVLHGSDGMDGEFGTEIRKFAEEIARHGFVVFLPDYFDGTDRSDTGSIEQVVLARVGRFTSYADRVAEAVRQVQRQTDVDATRLGLVGFSLGGGLALAYAEAAPAGQLRALVDFFGFVVNQGILANAGRLPPTLILHNVNDGVVEVALSSGPLVEALGKTSVPHEHHFLKDDNPAAKHHPFLPGGEADVKARSLALAWLEKHVTR